MKNWILLVFLAFISLNVFGQSTEIKKVKYAKTEIDVPENYTANDHYSLESSSFSAQWLYLTEEMVAQGVSKQILMQFESQIEYSKISEIEFISNKGKFSGKKYKLKGEKKFNYRIIAFGLVDGQPLVLNLGFKDDPLLNEKLDDLTKQFFQLIK